MSGKIKLQHLKALERAPQGTLAFRSYLLRSYYTILYNKGFGGLELKIPSPLCRNSAASQRCRTPLTGSWSLSAGGRRSWRG